MLRFLGRSMNLIASRKVKVTLPFLRLRLSPYSVDTTNLKPVAKKIVLKNARELVAYLLSTARDDGHIESRLEALRHAFIPSSEPVSVSFTGIGNDQWFYSLLETVVARDKKKIFPVRIDSAVHPVIVVDLVPELTTEIELIFLDLHKKEGEESGIFFSKCAQVAQEIADKLHPTNSVVQNMVEVLIVVLQRSWKASIDPNTNELLKETFCEVLTKELLAHPALRYHINVMAQLFSFLNLPVSAELESEMEQQNKKRLDLYQTVSIELQGLIKNHVVAEKKEKKVKKVVVISPGDKKRSGRPRSPTSKLSLPKMEENNAPESDPLYITLFCSKIPDSTAQPAAAPSESEVTESEVTESEVTESEVTESEVTESDSLSIDSFESSEEEPEVTSSSFSSSTASPPSRLREYRPLPNSPFFNPEKVDSTHFTRARGTLVVDNLPPGVVNSIVLNKLFEGISIKKSQLFRFPTTTTTIAPKEKPFDRKSSKKKKAIEPTPTKLKKLSQSMRTDNYAVVELADAASFNALMHESVRIFGIVIMGQSCNVYPVDHLKRFIIELPEPVIAKEVLKAMRKIFRGHFDIETMQGIPHHRRKDRNSAPVNNKERILLCNFEFYSSNEAFEAFQLLAKKLKRSMKLSSPLLPPLWLSNNRTKEDRALHARLKNSLDRLKAKLQASAIAAASAPIAAPGDSAAASGPTDSTTDSSPPSIIDNDSTTNNRDTTTTISLIVN